MRRDSITDAQKNTKHVHDPPRIFWFYNTSLLCMLQDYIATLWMYLTTAFLTPLRHLYLHGPALGNYGFWGGHQHSDICAAMTSVSATHWNKHPAECEDLVERKFRAFVLGFLFIGTLVAGIYAFICLMCRACCLKPILKAFKPPQHQDKQRCR